MPPRLKERAAETAVDPGPDDHTPIPALTYALYVGASADAARTTSQVERFVLIDSAGEISFNASYDWTESDMFLSVSTLDYAGNESARSAPIQIHSAASGCRIVSRSSFGSFAWVIAAMTWHMTRRRRKATARASHLRARRIAVCSAVCLDRRSRQNA
jgi:hypothetical protein